MSLIASSAASRHLCRRLVSNANASASCHLRIGGDSLLATTSRRHLSSNQNGLQGGGLRRAQQKGRRAKKSSAPSQSTASSSSGGGGAPSYDRADPHLVANEATTSASAGPQGRTPGTESVASLTREQKLSNYAMATGLLAFVSYVFYYSLASVGGGENAKALIFGKDPQQEDDGEGKTNPGFEEFLKEANEGRSVEEKRLEAEREARGEALELAELEGSTKARLEAEGVGEEVIVGGATEEEERAMARTAGFDEGGEDPSPKKRRPLWKRVVFFWRRE